MWADWGPLRIQRGMAQFRDFRFESGYMCGGQCGSRLRLSGINGPYQRDMLADVAAHSKRPELVDIVRGFGRGDGDVRSTAHDGRSTARRCA